MMSKNILHFSIRKPDDFHVHFRQGKDLPAYVKASAAWCARALVMPNTVPAIRTAADALRYNAEIARAAESADFTPLMICKLYENHTPKDIAEMKRAGVIACKLYPRGVTTHSDDGVAHPLALKELYKEMESQDMVLCVHGEHAQSFVLDREKNFLNTLDFIREAAPKLRIVLEHVSCAEAVEYVRCDTTGLLAATVTVHHLLFTMDHLLGGYINPHLFCKPVLKTPRDLAAIQAAVAERDPHFFLGTDSAPHHVQKKECASGCAGIYSASVALPLLAHFFCDIAPKVSLKNISSAHDALDWTYALQSFTSEYGAHFYGLPQNCSTVSLSCAAWKVSEIIDGAVPLCAGKTLAWQVDD